ncbi:hypothetical protein BESB_005660 [Besnoitia besnoiti]|uniref:Uncharacterized protein n=1 Tax=Besnoitia besnoiti TaxID=94643 RepID=A0A2A9MJS8_BESBE|nr:hypothetical protein BESB_005660 [Besnoitia besnoiti]PFH38225.1 hypothetical protein BESB_005660 [Besnoitia besnoiti]
MVRGRRQEAQSFFVATAVSLSSLGYVGLHSSPPRGLRRSSGRARRGAGDRANEDERGDPAFRRARRGAQTPRG